MCSNDIHSTVLPRSSLPGTMPPNYSYITPYTHTHTPLHQGYHLVHVENSQREVRSCKPRRYASNAFAISVALGQAPGLGKRAVADWHSPQG